MPLNLTMECEFCSSCLILAEMKADARQRLLMVRIYITKHGQGAISILSTPGCRVQGSSPLILVSLSHSLYIVAILGYLSSLVQFALFTAIQVVAGQVHWYAITAICIVFFSACSYITVRTSRWFLSLFSPPWWRALVRRLLGRLVYSRVSDNILNIS